MAADGINKTSGFNVQLAPRVGAALPTGKHTTIKASFGFQGCQSSLPLYALGNPNARQTRIFSQKKVTGMDAGVEHHFGEKVVVSGTYYYNLFSNLIDFSAGGVSAWRIGHSAYESAETLWRHSP